jgi:hypothetical protein
VTHEGRELPAWAEQLAAARKTSPVARRAKVTAMGVCEVLMWGAGAGAVVGFWLWQRAEGPAAGDAATKPRYATVVSTRDADRLSEAGNALWQERFRAAMDGLVSRDADPASTGSAPAPAAGVERPAAHSLDVENAAPSEPAEERAPLVTATPDIEPRGDEIDPRAETASVAAQLDEAPSVERLERSDPLTSYAALADPQPDVQMPLPPEPPVLDLIGLPQDETDFQVPEAIVLQSTAEADPAPAPHPVATSQSDPLQVVVPDADVILTDVGDADRGASAEQLAAVESGSVGSALSPVHEESLITRGEEALARGDVAAARLFFGRAAAAGDPRGATGMARTFHPETFRNLRVFGMRPDAEQAAWWHSRSKALQAVASNR